MKVLVLGGYGEVGARIVTKLRDHGEVALAAGRDPRRADIVIDLREPHTLSAALPGVDLVVNAAGTEEPALVETITRHGAAFVDITATTDYVAAVERLEPSRPVILSVGLAPGLTNLLAAAVHDGAPQQPIDIALLLGAGERYGPASTTWAYGLFGRPFRDTETGDQIRNYTRPRRFDLPGYGSRRLYRTNYCDQHVLSRDFGVPVRTHFGLDSPIATTALAALTWIPGARKTPPGLHPPGGDRWLALAQSRDGLTRWVGGRIQSQATAVMAATAARTAIGLPSGVHHLHHVLKLADLDDAHVSFS
jgi:saccharopine dehydrogenase-like NADP-dependent oxidoreductase